MKELKISQVVCIAMLLLAVADNPYIYYKILRWVVFLTSGYLTIFYFKTEQVNCTLVLAFLFVGIATLFNPIFPVSLDRSTWQIIDVGVAMLFIVHLIFMKFFKSRLRN